MTSQEHLPLFMLSNLVLIKDRAEVFRKLVTYDYLMMDFIYKQDIIP
jgi:hypothetical protein